MLQPIKRTLQYLTITLLAVTAISLTTMRFLLPQVKQYRPYIEQELSSRLNIPIRIGKIGTNMRGFEPEFVFTNITLAKTEANPAIKFKEIRISINFLRALQSWDIFSAWRVTLVGTRLHVKRKPDGSILIEGLRSSSKKPLWPFKVGYFEAIQSQITWHDQMLQRPPRTYSDVDVASNSNFLTQQHIIHIRVNPSNKQPSTLRLSMQITGSIFAAKNLNGEIYIAGSALKLEDFIVGSLLKNWQVGSGQGSFQVWGRWQQSKLVSLTGYLGLTNVLLTHFGRQNTAIPSITSSFNWRHQGQKWYLDLNNLKLNDGQKIWPKIDLSLSFNPSLTGKPKLGLAVPRFTIAEAIKLADLVGVANNSIWEYVKASHAQGIIKDFLFFTDTEFKNWAINGSIDRLKTKAVGSMFGVINLSGKIIGNNQSGRLTLTSHDAMLIKPDLFRQPLLIEKLQGDIDWQRSGDQWQVNSNNLQVDVPALKTSNRLQIQIPENLDKKQFFFDIQSHFVDGDLPAMKAYWPVGVLSKNLIAWLDNAYRAGRISEGNALFYGKLQDYPFATNNGLFELKFKAKDVALAHHKNWPHFTNFDAQVHYRNDNINISAKDWQINGVNVVNAFVQIPLLKNSKYLSLQATLKGKIQHSLDFLQRTPLQKKISRVTKLLKVTGDHVVNLHLSIPLNKQDSAKIVGVVKLDEAQLKVLPANLVANNIKGELQLNERGIFTQETLTAKTLNYPIKFKIKQHKEATEVKVEGDTDMRSLYDQYRIKRWKFARGKIPYAVDITIPNNPEMSSKITLNSDLDDVVLSRVSSKTASVNKLENQFIFTDLGALHLQLITANNSIKIKKFTLKGAKHKLTLRGGWSSLNSKLHTLVEGKFEAENLGDLLANSNISEEILGSKSLFNFSLQWQGMPYQFNLATVKGIVDAKLGRGSLVGIKPGIGRILGIFDLTEWRRRIALDFSDFTTKGFAYNSIEGLFRLSDGVAKTDNLLIEGVSAKIKIIGKTDLVGHNFDQIVTVTPRSAATIPFVGTIAGAVVQTFTGYHLDSLMRIQYQITGDWKQPLATRTYQDGILRKTWSGIADFTHLNNTKQK